MLLFLRKKNKKCLHKKLFPDYKCFDLILKFIAEEWEKWKIFFWDYELIYPRLITSLKWHFDYVFFERKKKNGKCSWKNVWKYSRCDPWNLHTKILPGQDIPIKEGTHIFDFQEKQRSAIVQGKRCTPQKNFRCCHQCFFLVL